MKIGQSRSSTAADFFLNNKGHYGNYSKYNSVKRNSGKGYQLTIDNDCFIH